MADVSYPASVAVLQIDGEVGDPSGIDVDYPPSIAMLELDGDAAWDDVGPIWRLTVTNQEGGVIMQLPEAFGVTLTERLNDVERLEFALDANTEQARRIATKDELPLWEVQAWRGREMRFFGPLIDAVETPQGDLRVTARGAFEHLNRTVIGKAGRRNLLTNPAFSGLAGWGVIRSTGLAQWADPTGYYEVVGDQSATGGPDLPGNAAGIVKITNPVDTTDVVSIWQDVTLTAPPDRDMAYVARALFWVPSEPVVRNDKDLAVAVSNLPTDYSPPLGWYTEVKRNEYDRAQLAWMTHGSIPLGRWYERGAKLRVEAGDTVVVHVAFQTPPGVGYIALPAFMADESLDFYDTDVASVVAGLVTHAQDEVTFSKVDRNIDTHTPATGKVVDRSYLHDQHGQVGRMIDQLASDQLGDWAMLYGSTERILTWSYPRRAPYRPKANIVWGDGGGNVEDLRPSTRWTNGSTVVILQDPRPIGFERAESVARVGSLGWEEVGVTPPELTLQDQQGATNRLADVAAYPRAITTTHAHDTIHVRGYLRPGDVVNIYNQANGADDSARWRLLARTTDCDNDTAEIDWVPEVA